MNNNDRKTEDQKKLETECERFRRSSLKRPDYPGRFYELCTGQNHGGPLFSRASANGWRASQGLGDLPAEAVIQPTQASQWDVSQPSRGLGDVVKKFTHATGIDKAVDVVSTAITGKPGGCGCAKRQETLNTLIPFKGTTDGQ